MLTCVFSWLVVSADTKITMKKEAYGKPMVKCIVFICFHIYHSKKLIKLWRMLNLDFD